MSTNNELKNMNQNIKELKAKLVLAKANLRFAALPAPAKRVAVMKDVLELLAAPASKRIQIEPGTYCSLDMGVDSPESVDLQSVVVSNPSACTVCGIGAIFLAHARLFDSVRVDADYAGLGAGDDKIIDTLSGYFSEKQLRLIEIAFEGRNIFADDDYDANGAKWVRKYSDPTKRLQAICQNVIDNKGTFVINQIR